MTDMSQTSLDPYDIDLDPTPANYAPLTPLVFLDRSAAVYPEHTAVIYGERRYSYAQYAERCRRLGAALAARGIGRGDTVAVMAPNIPELLEAHFGVPMTGAVLNAINIRLDAGTVGFILRHGNAKVAIVDTEFAPVVRKALEGMENPPLLVDLIDPAHDTGERLGTIDYEAFIASGDPSYAGRPVENEWQAIALNYTSGTTGDPKGVVAHHRGAYLAAFGNAMVTDIDSRSVYLWTLPMFHCNGWSFTWAVAAVAGTHVCLRRVEAAAIFTAVAEHKVTTFCGAPIVLTMLIHAPQGERRAFDHRCNAFTGGAAPPSAVIAGMERLGFTVTQLYGLTETYGPSMVCVPQDRWADAPLEERSRFMARQGVHYPSVDELMVADPETMQPVPHDGETIGEIMLRGNTVMKGYLKNPKATEASLAGGWFHTGDLAVCHPDGYAEVKDRSKDIIISGGENISSLEVEEVLYGHPDVMEAAVVAQPDEKWGESPCAFVTLKPGVESVDAKDLTDWCRARMAHYKIPKRIVFGPLPKTSTGKIQKFNLREQAKELAS